MKTYKVLSVCGSGVATSTLAATKLSEGLKNLGVNIDITECKMTEVKAKVDSYIPDVIINTTEINKDDCKGIESYSAVPFLTGIGEEQLVEKIYNYLTK